MKKPKFLYHGSPIRGLKVIEPRAISIRDHNEGPVVFATPDLVLASMFIVPVDDSFVNMGYVGETPIFHCGDKKRFLELDKGGAIYILSSEAFSFDSNKGMGDLEWTSTQAVVPIKEMVYDSALD